MIPRLARKHRIEATEIAEPTDSTDANEAIEPTDKHEPIEPTERTEFREPIDSSEFCDHIDHFEPATGPIVRAGHGRFTQPKVRFSFGKHPQARSPTS
jgi:hypothetical protein